MRYLEKIVTCACITVFIKVLLLYYTSRAVWNNGVRIKECWLTFFFCSTNCGTVALETPHGIF